MKNTTLLKFIQIIMVILVVNLFVSCDMDKVTSAVTDSINAEENTPTSAEIGIVDIAFCDSNVDNHHGCSCNFKDADGSGSSIFTSNMDQSKSACISINGKSVILTGKRIDARNDHYRHSFIPDWIVLDPNGEVHIFNELVDDSKYDENKDLIVQTLLVTNNLPEDVKVRKNKGPNGEEVSADLANKYEKMWAEALEIATKEKANNNHGAPLEIELSNELFDVYVHGTVENHNEDGSDNYKGQIEIKSKSGKLLGSKDFVGTCHCDD